MRRVYLDQNAWIALAAVHYGKSKNEAIADALVVAEAGVEAGRVSFPLSYSHYYETYRRGDPASRQRLGRFMGDLARFHAIAAAPDVLETEVRVALAARGGWPAPAPPKVFGIGAKHAFGDAVASYFSDPEAEARAVAKFGSEVASRYFEEALLMGPPERLPWGDVRPPSRESSQKQLALETETATLLRTEGHTRDLAHRVVLAQEVSDMWDLVRRLMDEMHVPEGSRPASAEAMTSFVFDLPAKGLITRMRMTGHENPKFRWQIGDLNDLAALGMAGAYCDVVVAEKQWGDVLARHRDHCRAKVITRVADLAAALVV
jgi:hypothetical protein